MKQLRSLANRVARKMGFTVMSTWRLKHLEASEHLRNLFTLYSVDLVLDVGANVGQYGDFLRHHVGYMGWIASYEPDPETYKTLSEHSQNDEHWRVFNLALGSNPGTAKFNVSIASALSSFLKPDLSESEHAARKRETLRQIDVVVDTVDRQLPNLVATLQIKRPYLKMDTQGFDLEVLRGAEQSLSQFAGLQFEGSVVPLYQGMPNYADMLRHMNERGFSISDMFPVTKDHSLRLIEFDCVMIRNPD